MSLNEALEEYGLENREAKVYLALLEYGEQTANNISKKTSILRQTVYEIFDKLAQKGLVKHIVKNNVRWFEAVDPERLDSLLIEKREIIKKIFPKLKKLQQKTTQSQSISTFEGIEGLKSIYALIIRDSPKELLEYGNSKQFIELMKFYFVQNYMRKRVANKTKLRLITEPGKKIESLYGSNKKLCRETKYSKIINEMQTASYIYDDIFIILSFGKEPKGIVIKNSYFARTQKLLFEQMWNLANKF